MEIKIYQIDSSLDTERVKFMKLDYIKELNPSIYRKVFEGNVGCQALEGVYAKFNCGSYPDDYHGHSLSVSDIIETKDGCFYCDSIGFEKVEFDTSKVGELPMLRIMCMHPGKQPEITEIFDSYKSFEKLVGEFTCSYTDGFIAVHNKDNAAEHPIFVAAANDEGDMISVREDQADTASLFIMSVAETTTENPDIQM